MLALLLKMFARAKTLALLILFICARVFKTNSSFVVDFYLLEFPPPPERDIPPLAWWIWDCEFTQKVQSSGVCLLLHMPARARALSLSHTHTLHTHLEVTLLFGKNTPAFPPFNLHGIIIEEAVLPVKTTNISGKERERERERESESERERARARERFMPARWSRLTANQLHSNLHILSIVTLLQQLHVAWAPAWSGTCASNNMYRLCFLCFCPGNSCFEEGQDPHWATNWATCHKDARH